LATALAASAVVAPCLLPATGGRLRFELVATHNEREVRQLLREAPVPGWITLAYEREPDYLLGTTLEGPVQQTVLARTVADGTLVGTFSRSERLAFVNGEPRPLGYLGLLRLRDRFRGRTRYLREGYEACRRFLHDPARTPYYVTSVIEGNTTARRVLEAGLPGLPVYRPWQAFSTLALPCRRHPGTVPRGLQVVPGSPQLLGDIAACLQRNYARYALAPYWTADDLASPERCRGLRPQDFRVALRGDRVVGCLALWDQRAFKQHVACGYTPTVGRWRGPINVAARLLSLPRLPEPGEALAEATLSHAASDDDDPAVLLALVGAARAEAHRRGLAVVTLGLALRNPMLRAVRAAFRHLEYRSILYLVHWDDGRAAAAALDDRPAHLEAATL
jgi:hypothetical protein